MVKSVAWNWDNQIENIRWQEPAQEVYYLAERWQAQGRARLLDLGCGIGRHSIFFAQRGFSVDAFDLSERGVAVLEQAAQERQLFVRARVGDMLSLPYETGAFDCVLAYHVIFHTNRAGLEQVIAEIRRVLAAGGELFVTFNSVRNPSYTRPTNQVLEPHTVLQTEGHEAGIPHHHVDEAEVRELLAGFEFIRFTQGEEILTDHSSWHYFVLARKS
jgi:SAM-dependent methyltransferase